MFKKKRKNMFVNEEVAKKVENNIFFTGKVPDVRYNQLNQSLLNNNSKKIAPKMNMMIMMMIIRHLSLSRVLL